MEFATALIFLTSRLVKYPFAVAKRRVAYLIFYKRHLNELRELVEQLRVNRDRIQLRVDEAMRNALEIHYDVQVWLREVDEVIEEAEEFYKQARFALAKFCNSPFLCFRLSKTVEMREVSVIRLLEYRFDDVGLMPGIHRQIANTDFHELGSRMMILEEMMEALYDDNINMIGVCGMGGVGKTTLVKQLAKLAMHDGLFEVVVMIAVTRNAYVPNMQGEIADMLGFTLSEESPDKRAAQICERLKKEKEVLIILDDVWEHLDLAQIGIPSANDRRIFKTIVTSRSINVLRQMEVQKNFEIKRLSENESLSLFLEINGIADDTYHLYHELAVEISNSCQGLPVLLVTVARALRFEDLSAWKDALKKLKLHNEDDSGGFLFSAIELIINSLEYEVKLILLMCAALGKEIFSEQLVKHCLTWGLFEHNETVEEARNKMVRGIRSLQASSLLQLQDGKMIIDNPAREVALQIASEEYNIFVVQDGIEDTKWPDDEVLIQNFTAIFLLGKHKGELPERLVCPKLELFHVYDETQTLAIPDNFFEQINEGLQVLSLNNVKLSSLPSSFCLLTNIQTLCLDKCELLDIALLGKLITLKVLSLSGSNIKRLPYQMRDLINLWLLDLDNCSKLESIPPTVISNLTRLQELLLPNSFSQWQHSEGSNNENASLSELSHLNDMKALQIHIPEIELVPQDFPWNKLVRYNISIGGVQGRWSGNFERKLQLKFGTNIDAYDWVKPLLVKSEELWLKELKGFKSVLELDHDGFQKLKHLHIQDIAEMEWLVNSEFPNPLPILELLALNNLTGLKGICYTQPSILISFNELRAVKVERCHNVDFIFSSSLCRGLKKLREMDISTCTNLGAIVGGNKEEQASDTQGDEGIAFPELRAMTLKDLAQLVGFMSKEITQETNVNSSISFTFDEKVVFPNLEKLNIRGLHRLTIIFNYHILNLQKLTSLVLSECDNLKYLFSSQAAKALSFLQELRITACKSVEEIVVAESGTDTYKITLPRVKTLILENLAKLRSFCWDGCIIEWQSLIKVRVENCPKILRYALGIVDKSNLEVEVKECPWHKEDDPKNSTEYLFVLSDPFEKETTLDIKSSDHLRTLVIKLQPLSFSNLTELSASKCDETLSNFLSWLIRRSRKLLHLEIKQCESLVQIFNLQNLVADERVDGKYFDQLKTIKLLDLPDLSCIWNKDPTGILGLHNLEEIEVVNCGFLKTIIPTSLAQHLWQLKVLKISSCPTIEVVHMNPKDETGKREIVFPELHTLELVLLKNLKRLHTPDYLLQFPSMGRLVIEDCSTLDAFTGGFLNAQSLPAIEGKSEEELQGEKAAYTKMKNLKLKGLQNIEEIWQGSFLPGSFSELREVEMKALAKLKYLVSSNMLPMLKDLEKITVKDCELITEVFKITEEFEFVSTMFSKPSTMVLIGLPKLVHIIKMDYVGSGIFENLQTLVLKSCNSFRSLVFPSSCLHMLTKLEISECNVLEEIIVIKGKGDIEEKMLFTNLKSFVLESLPELSTFCQEAFELPYVEEISIISCPKLKTFPTGLPTKDYLSTVTNHFIKNQGPFEKLQKLHLANLDKLDFRMIAWNQTMSPKSLCELQELELGQSSELFQIIPSNLLNRVQKLKKCIVRDCEMLKFAFEVDEGNHQIEEWLPQLEELVLTDLPRMVFLMQEPKISIFKNLAFLEFVRCSSLKTLFSISIAKNLHQLELLKLYDCKEIEYVLEGNAGNEKVFEFKKLKCLILMYLPKLISFCDEDCEFELPELKIVRVKNIPKMRTFAKEIPKTPKLKEFYITYVSNCWQGDLNKTMEYLQNYPGAENAGHMKVEHTQLNPQTVTDYSEGDDSAVVPPPYLEQEESNKGVAQENEDLITEVPEEAVILNDCDRKMMSRIEEKVGVSDIDDDKGQLVKDVVDDRVVEEIVAACERRPEFLPACSDVLRRVLLQHPILTEPFRKRSSRLAGVSYELLADVLFTLEERNPSKMSDADFNALLVQLEELKMLGFDHSWVDSLRHRVTTQVQRDDVYGDR